MGGGGNLAAAAKILHLRDLLKCADGIRTSRTDGEREKPAADGGDGTSDKLQRTSHHLLGR